MSSTFNKYYSILVILLLAPGCVSTGLMQQSGSPSQTTTGVVQVIGPILRPQRVNVPSAGTTMDRVVGEGRRAGQLPVTQLFSEFVYRQRGLSRVYVPTVLLQTTSLGDMRILPGDAVCAIPYNQTPLWNRATRLEATIILKGMLTEADSGVNSSERIQAAKSSDGEYALAISDFDEVSVSSETDGAAAPEVPQRTPKPATYNTLANELINATNQTLGLQTGISRNGLDIPAEVAVLRCVAEDGFIEEYIIPIAFDQIAPDPASQFGRGIQDVKLKDGDIIDVTRIEFLPHAIEGNVVATLTEAGSVASFAEVEEKQRKCKVETGPLLQPLSAVLRTSAQQSSAVLRNSLKPATDLLRAQSGL